MKGARPLAGVRLAPWVLAAALTVSCAGSRRAAMPPAAPPLHLEPLTGLAAAGRLSWLIDLRPRELTENVELIPAIAQIIPDERFASFAAASGGVDLREPQELAVAAYGDTTLWLVQTSIDPNRVEPAFDALLLSVDGRSVDRPSSDPLGVVIHAWGTTAAHEHEELAIFGRQALAFQHGSGEALRAAELFAEGRLHRASPALAADPLARASEVIGDAPVRIFAPGPFSGGDAAGLGGLFAGATAVAARVRVASGHARPGLSCTLVLFGAWGDDASAAGTRLAAAIDVLSSSSLGRLLGLRNPMVPVRIKTSPDALTLDVTVDAMALSSGLRDATSGTVDAIMGGASRRARSH